MADTKDKWLQESLGVSEKNLALKRIPHVTFREKEGTTFVQDPAGGLAEDRHGSIEQIDEMRASLVAAFRVSVARMGNAEIVREALKLDAKLAKGKAAVGPKEKSAIAETLIEMYQVLDSRIKAAPFDSNTELPKIEGLKWDEGSPLAGNLMDIAPFGNLDLWYTFVVGAKAPPRKPRPHAKKKTPKVESKVTKYEPKKIDAESDEGVIKHAIKAVEEGNSAWKPRDVRILNFLLNPSADDRVLLVQEYIRHNQPPAIKVMEPEDGPWILHVRENLLKYLRRASSSEQVERTVENIVQPIHDGYMWGRKKEARETFGGGSSASRAERMAAEWLAKKQRDPKSVYSVY